jgi:hypothetical protein
MVHDKMYSREALRVGGSALGTGQPPVWLPHRVNRSADHCNNMNSRSNHLTSSRSQCIPSRSPLGFVNSNLAPALDYIPLRCSPTVARARTRESRHAACARPRHEKSAPIPNASVSKEVLWIKLYERPPHTSINSQKRRSRL